MYDSMTNDTTLLTAFNVVLGLFCALCWICVLVAIACDVITRLRIRASLPKGWPPENETEKKSVAIPDGWPPAEEKLEV